MTHKIGGDGPGREKDRMTDQLGPGGQEAEQDQKETPFGDTVMLARKKKSIKVSNARLTRTAPSHKR